MIKLKNDFAIRCEKCDETYNIESIKHEMTRNKCENGDVEYVLSDVFLCSKCGNEIKFRFNVADDTSLSMSKTVEGGIIDYPPQFEHIAKELMINIDSTPYDSKSIESIYSYAKKLVGMKFSDVYIDYKKRHQEKVDIEELKKTNSKGLLGNFIEKYYFDYDINPDQRPDFADVGVELKQTCIDQLKKGGYTAGERLSITNISYEEPVEYDFYKSHVWDKIHRILLIQYLRDKNIANKLDYEIKFVNLFTPPKEDLKIIKEDYLKIITKIAEGKAHELSESDTLYLGAATKGKTAKDSTKPQFYGDHTPARKRNFCLKQSYMNYVLKTYVLKQEVPCDYIVSLDDSEKPFEEVVLERLMAYRGKTDRILCKTFDIEYPSQNKSLWSNLAFRMLGIKSNKAEEFEKANVVVKAIRIEEDDTINESMPLITVDFIELAAESWESSNLYNYISGTRFLFVIYKKVNGEYRFMNAKFWNMSNGDLEIVRQGWTSIRDKIRDGVSFKLNGNRVFNDIPGKSDNPIMHMRPHTALSAYKLNDGFSKGNFEKHGCQLPDGQWMTKQSFWLNNDYILSLVKEDIERYG